MVVIPLLILVGAVTVIIIVVFVAVYARVQDGHDVVAVLKLVIAVLFVLEIAVVVSASSGGSIRIVVIAVPVAAAKHVDPLIVLLFELVIRVPVIAGCVIVVLVIPIRLGIVVAVTVLVLRRNSMHKELSGVVPHDSESSDKPR